MNDKDSILLAEAYDQVVTITRSDPDYLKWAKRADLNTMFIKAEEAGDIELIKIIQKEWERRLKGKEEANIKFSSRILSR